MASNKLILRDYNPNDFNRVKKLWKETDLDNTHRGDDNKIIEQTIRAGGKLIILEDIETDIIIGTSWLTSDSRRLYLHHFGIKPECQKKGYSRLLLQESLNFAKKTGLQIKLEVHKTNKKAIELYKKAGFKYLGDYHVYIIRSFD